MPTHSSAAAGAPSRAAIAARARRSKLEQELEGLLGQRL